MTETWIDEVWVTREDGRIATVTGRRRRNHLWSLSWFFQNDLEPTPPPTYLPDGKFRQARWMLRNPLQNFGRWVVGVCDRNYTVVGSGPVMATTWLDVDRNDGRSKRSGLIHGWKWSVIKLGPGLPFVSYTGKRVLWYAGFQWWGFFGFKWNILHSSVQVA